MRPRRRLAPALALALLSTGCGAAVSSLAATPGDARHQVGELLGALASRFGPLELGAREERLRARLLQASLVPSLAFDDPSAWTETTAEVHTVRYSGFRVGAGYRIRVTPSPPAPSTPGDYRGAYRLRSLGSGGYVWTVSEELAVGPITGEGLDRALTALFRALESLPEPVLERHLRGGDLPRAAAVLGRLLRLEAVEVERFQGATSLRLECRLDPAGLDSTYPRYARYLAKYAAETEASVVATDPRGVAFWEASLASNSLALRLRVHDGSLAPLTGPPRRLPSRILVRSAFAMRTGPFRVGFSNLLSSVDLRTRGGERFFEAHFKQEPEWRIPFLVRPFLRGPLRYPFEGSGSSLRYGIRDGGNGPTLLYRDYRVPVRESWLVRWIGGMVGSAVGEFRRDAEAEADRFSAELLLALRADLLALPPRPVRTVSRGSSARSWPVTGAPVAARATPRRPPTASAGHLPGRPPACRPGRRPRP